MDIINANLIKISMKNNSSITTAQFYFTTDADTTWDEAKHLNFPINANDPNYTEYTVDMSGVPGWTGTLKQLRLDPNAGGSNGSFSVDYIRVQGSSGGPPPTPTPVPPTATPVPPTPTPTATPGSGVTYISDLNWTLATIGWGTIQKDASVESNTITLNGTTYSKGIGTHAHSEIVYNLSGNYTQFLSDVGVDDEVDGSCNGSGGSVGFQVYVDGVQKFDSGAINTNDPTQAISVNVGAANELKLIVTDGGNGISCDHGDWAGARLTSGSSTSYEAESGNNTLGGGAIVTNVNCGSCSGGQKVGYVGNNDGTLQFN